MTYFPTDLLTRYRTKADTALPSVCTLHNKTLTADSSMGTKETRGAQIGASIPCRLGRGRLVTLMRDGKMITVTQYDLTLHSSRSATNGQLITLNSVIYEVVEASGRDWQISQVAKLERWS